MKDKFMSKVTDVRARIKNHFSDIPEIVGLMFDRHPMILGALEGCVIVYGALVVSCFFMKLFCKKQLGWVKM